MVSFNIVDLNQNKVLTKKTLTLKGSLESQNHLLLDKNVHTT